MRGRRMLLRAGGTSSLCLSLPRRAAPALAVTSAAHPALTPVHPSRGPLTRLPVGEEHHRLNDHKLGQRADGPQLVVSGLQGGAGGGPRGCSTCVVAHLKAVGHDKRTAAHCRACTTDSQSSLPHPAPQQLSSTRLVQQHEAVQRPGLGKVVDQGNVRVCPAGRPDGDANSWMVAVSGKWPDGAWDPKAPQP